MEKKSPGFVQVLTFIFKKNFFTVAFLIFSFLTLTLFLNQIKNRQNIEKKMAADAVVETGPNAVCNYDVNYNCFIGGTRSVSSPGAGNFDSKGMTFDVSGNFRPAVIFNDSLKGLVYNTSDLLTESNKTSGTIAMWVKPNFDLGFGTQTSDDHVLFQMYESSASRINLIIKNGNKLEFMLNNNDQGTLANHGIIAKISMVNKCASTPCATPPAIPGCANTYDPVYDCSNEDISVRKALSWNKGEWHWVVASWGTNGTKLFVDGDMMGFDKTLTTGPPTFSPQTYIGIFRDGISNNANSSVDDLKIWNRQISDQEVHQMMKDYYYSRESSETRRYTPKVTIDSPLDEKTAGTTGNHNIKVTLNEPILPGGGIRFLFKLAGFWGVSTDVIDALINGAPMGGMAYIRSCGYATYIGQYCEIIANQQLPSGTMVTFRLGKDSNLMTFPQVARKLDIETAVNTGGGFFFETLTPAYVNVVSKAVSGMGIFLTPSTVSYSTAPVGQPIPYVIVKVEDEYLNTATGFRGTIIFRADPSIKIGNNSTSLNGFQYPFTDQDKGVKRFDNIIFNNPGKFQIEVSRDGGSTYLKSNYVIVGPQPITEYNNYKLYWGDLHSHSIFSDGMGTVEENFDFARNKSGLNFAAISDHAAEPNSDHSNPAFIRNIMDPYNWSAATAEVNRKNVKNEFVAILGYEYGHGSQRGIYKCLADNPGRVDIDCAANYSVEGDWNVYYDGDGPLLAPQNTSDLIAQVGSWKQSNGPNSAFIIPHHGGRIGAMSVLINSPALISDPSLVPGIEVISTHISTPNPVDIVNPNAFEEWVRTGISKWFSTNNKVRLGIMASSDNHSSMPGRPVDGSKMGIMAVWATDLSRTSIFDAISKRRFYAYSHGNRPIVELYATGADGVRHVMGEEFSIGAIKPKIGYSVTSSVGIKSVQIIKGTSTGASTLVNGNVAYQAPLPVEATNLIEDTTYSGNSYYYLKVIMENTGIVWTSPIWIKNDMPTSTPATAATSTPTPATAATSTPTIPANTLTPTVPVNTLTPTPTTSTPSYLMRLNIGGPSYIDPQGKLWQADKVYAIGGYGYTGGQQYSTPSVITGTTNPVLYQTERYNMTSYKFTVPNGSYDVTLKFAEIYSPNCAPNKRGFNVDIQNLRKLANFDIFVNAGSVCFTAVDRTFTGNVVTNGLLTILFSTVAGRDVSAINGIEITSAGGAPTSTPTIVPTAPPQSTSTPTPGYATSTPRPNTPTPTYSPNTPTPTPASGLFWRLNAGCTAATCQYTDTMGRVWQPDQVFSTATGGYGYINTSPYTSLTYSVTNAITGTSDQTLYKTDRYTTGTGLKYQFNVPNGNYTVTLKFAETYYMINSAGKRVFDIKINGVVVRSSFDVFSASTGLYKAVDLNFYPSVVNNVPLTIEFIKKVNSPKVNAIGVVKN